jgi:hypothetical protein
LNQQRDAMLKANPNQDIPPPDGVERPNAKVIKIVDDIMQLNILESIQLSKALQVRTARAALTVPLAVVGGRRYESGQSSSCPHAFVCHACMFALVPVTRMFPARVQKAMGLEGISIGMGGGGGGGAAPAAAAPAAAAKRQ